MIPPYGVPTRNDDGWIGIHACLTCVLIVRRALTSDTLRMVNVLHDYCAAEIAVLLEAMPDNE